MALAGFVSTWHRLELSKRKEPQLKKMPPVGLAVRYFLNSWLMGEDQLIVSGIMPALVVLVSIRKQAEQHMRHKPINNTPLYQLLSMGSCPVWIVVLTSLSGRLLPGSIIWNKPCPPHVALAMVFRHSGSSPTQGMNWTKWLPSLHPAPDFLSRRARKVDHYILFTYVCVCVCVCMQIFIVTECI